MIEMNTLETNPNPAPEVWDKVADGYNLEISDSEIEIANEISQLLKSLNIRQRASLLELGSGSGHLSGLLAQQGYKVTLLDFSEKALEKSKQFFDKHGLNGQFIKGDLLDLSNIESIYDVVWNSGVMEHFNDEQLLKAFKSIREKTKGIFIFLVPNPMSLPYLIFRYKLMREGNWIYGSEYLRTDYTLFLEAAGFKLINQHFLGWGITKYLLEAAVGSQEASKYFSEQVDNRLIPEHNAYLTAYVAIHAERYQPECLINKSKFGLTETKTNNFNLVANYNGLLWHYQKEKTELAEKIKQKDETIENITNEIQQKNQIIEEKEYEIREKESKLQEKRSELEEKESKLEEKRSELKEIQKELQEIRSEFKRMSDWAYSMKLRLEAIDGSYFIRILERVNRKKLRIISVYKEQGIKGIMTKIINRVCPRVPSYEVKQKKNIAGISQIKESIEKNNSNLIIAFPIIPWDFRWQRPQHILSKFANNGYIVIYLSMNVQPKGRVYKTLEEAGRDILISRLEEKIYHLHVCSQSQFNIYTDKLESGNYNNIYLGIDATLMSLNIQNPLYLVQFPGWSGLVYKLKEKYSGKIIFDCMDEHSGFSNNNDEVLAQEDILLKKSDLVIASSYQLQKKAKSKNKNTILVRNGTEFEHFNNVYPNGKLDHIKDKPIIGYYGAISDWFDIDLVEFCAKQKPDWYFILIGSTVGCDISRVKELPNIHLLGEIPYEELPGYLYYFDVCTIPFKITSLTLATNPVKFYEYLSCGKPVVSVRLPELEEYKEYCYLADDKQDFICKLEIALHDKDNANLISSRIELAKKNSWDSRFEVIKKEIEKLNNS